MTTNVFDENKAIMATDSRWSITHGKYVIYLDDAGFDKIEIANEHAFMFAGNGGRIQQWRDWIRTNPTDDTNQPKEEGICICVVNIESRKVVQSIKQTVLPDGGYFAGTGQLYAAPCWMKNKSAKRSVETAKKDDIYSGGEIKFYDFNSGEHNLNYPKCNITIQMVDDAILKRGLVMTLNTNQTAALPFALAANDNTELAEIRGKISAGDLSANAPSMGMYEEWSEKEKADLKKTFSNIFGWKK